MRINLTSVYVDNQRAALAFYVDVLGFTKQRDVPLGDDSWLTVVSPESPHGPGCCLSRRATPPSSRTGMRSSRTASRSRSSPSTTSGPSTSG